MGNTFHNAHSKKQLQHYLRCFKCQRKLKKNILEGKNKHTNKRPNDFKFIDLELVKSWMSGRREPLWQQHGHGE